MNDAVEMILDLNARIISYTVNEKNKTTVFRDIEIDENIDYFCE